MSVVEMPKAAEALMLHDEPDGLYEVIDGQIVEKTVGFNEGRLGFRLGRLLDEYAESTGRGQVFVENLFLTQKDPAQKRRPDIAFLSIEQWPRDQPFPEVDALDVAPDLVIEIISPTDRAWNVHEKTLEYFQAGVHQVWHIYRRSASIVIHESSKLARTYGRGDVLDGGDILPGFRLGVSDLIPEPAVEAPPAPERGET